MAYPGTLGEIIDPSESISQIHKKNGKAILICDLVGFTSFCEKNDPELVVETLQSLVENFEKAFEDFGLEKIKTVGDAIVAVAGLSSHAISPVKSCVDCSYKLREIANTSSMPWDLHLGIHSGSLVAGTVGTKTVQFDILGKTVNMAFNICDMSDSNQILISSDAWMTARNDIKVKSIGLKRLMARPVAKYTISAQEKHAKNEKVHADE